MQTSLVQWRVRPFFSFCWSSLKNIVAFGYRILRIVIPNSLHGVIWAIRTVVKLFVLFAGLIILLVGPRLGFPRAVHQASCRNVQQEYHTLVRQFQEILEDFDSKDNPWIRLPTPYHSARLKPDRPQATWNLLVRMGCVTTDDIVRCRPRGPPAVAAVAAVTLPRPLRPRPAAAQAEPGCGHRRRGRGGRLGRRRRRPAHPARRPQPRRRRRRVHPHVHRHGVRPAPPRPASPLPLREPPPRSRRAAGCCGWEDASARRAPPAVITMAAVEASRAPGPPAL